VSDEEHERASDERSDPEADSSADGVADPVAVAGRSTVDLELGEFGKASEEGEQQQRDHQLRDSGGGSACGGEANRDDEAKAGEEQAVEDPGLLVGEMTAAFAAGPETAGRAEHDYDDGDRGDDDREVSKQSELAFGHQTSVCVVGLPA